MDTLQNISVQISDFLWSYIIITVLICCALFFTWRTRFVQFRLIREMIRLLLHPDKVQPDEIGPDELSEELKVDGKMQHISSFQAFVVALTLLIIFGGIHRVAKFSSTVVPVMAVIYLVIAIGVVLWNITLLPKVVLTILENAFGFNQAAGGGDGHDRSRCFARLRLEHG